MTESEIIARLLHALNDDMVELAEEAMLRPKGDPFEHGVQCGKYQGMWHSKEILTAILRDDYNREINS